MYNKNKILVGFVTNKTIEKANHFEPSYFDVTVFDFWNCGGGCRSIG